jgi:hypothetical protein
LESCRLKLNFISKTRCTPKDVQKEWSDLEALPFRPDQVLEEVIEHGRDPVDHGRVQEHELDGAGVNFMNYLRP